MNTSCAYSRKSIWCSMNRKIHAASRVPPRTRRGGTLNRRLLLLALPCFAGMLLFYLLPLIGSARYSLLDSAFTQRFVGLEQYCAVLANRNFRVGVFNTVVLAALCVPALLAFSLPLSLFVQRHGTALPALRVALLMPMLLPSAAVTDAFQKFPLGGARGVLFAIYLWKHAGFSTLVFLAALSSVPGELYEAAALDGAGSATRFFRITLPSIAGIVGFVAVLAAAYNLRLFREAYLLYGNYPVDGAYLLQHYMNNHFARLEYPVLTAAALLFFGALLAPAALGAILRERRRTL